MWKPLQSGPVWGNPQVLAPTLGGGLENRRVNSGNANRGEATPMFRVLNARDDDDFTAQMYEMAEHIEPGLLAIGVGPVSAVLARDAQAALRSEDAFLLWLAPAGEGEIRLGLPEDLDDETLERAYAAVESAFPHLLDPRITVDVAPIAQVLALAAAAGATAT